MASRKCRLRPPASAAQRLLQFALWRWFFFLSLWAPVYWTTVLVMWALVKIVEWRFFTARTAIYFLVGTRVG